MILPLRPSEMCCICGRAVRLGSYKTDEHGCAVHVPCYAGKICSGERISPAWENAAAVEHQSGTTAAHQMK
jgi:hypothetical protein